VRDEADTSGVRLSDLVAALSYASDLGLGQPLAYCLRKTVIPLRLGDLAGLGDRDREATFYTRRCWPTPTATPTPRSRRAGSATTSRSRARPST
jgi:hypothetical protein